MSKAKHIFLWPQSRLRWRQPLRRGPSIAQLEKRFSELYPGTYPVLFPSLRSGLTAVIELLGLGRGDRIGIPPFASHCVWDAVSLRSHPLVPQTTDSVNSYLVYHQWGYRHRCASKAVILEDSADSLLLPGRRHFPNGGRFELVSLPKVLGTLSGGIIFCRDGADAEQLRERRARRRLNATVQFWLRQLAHRWPTLYVYWEGAELLNGNLPSVARADIALGLDRLDDILADRRRKLAVLSDVLPAWAKPDADRLPCSVPVLGSEHLLTAARAAGIITGSRHFNQARAYPSAQMVEVWPFPVHQEVPMALLEQMKGLLSRTVASLETTQPSGIH